MKRAALIAIFALAAVIGGLSTTHHREPSPPPPAPTVTDEPTSTVGPPGEPPVPSADEPAPPSDAYSRGFARGTPPFPRVTPPQSRHQVRDLCRLLSADQPSAVTKNYLAGCIDAGLKVQEENAGR